MDSLLTISEYAELEGITLEEAFNRAMSEDNKEFLVEKQGQSFVKDGILSDKEARPAEAMHRAESPAEAPAAAQELERLRSEVEELKQELREKDAKLLEYADRFAELAQQAQTIAGQAQILQAQSTKELPQAPAEPMHRAESPAEAPRPTTSTPAEQEQRKTIKGFAKWLLGKR